MIWIVIFALSGQNGRRHVDESGWVRPMAQKAKTSERGYGAAHQALRRVVQKQVEAGLAVCARCGQPIQTWEPWNLGHDDFDRSVWSRPEHRRCNRATNRKRRHSRRW